MGVPTLEALVQCLDEWRTVQIDELLAKDFVHERDVCSVRPVRVVYSSEGDTLLLTFNCSEHHVSRVN